MNSGAVSSNRTQGDVLVPVSIGELLDKITILQIKSERITEESKLVNIRKELDALVGTCERYTIPVEHPKVHALRAINESLWVVEDLLRDKERDKSFDTEFIRLARDVYVTNDRRAAVKRELNLELGSGYVEEKSYKPY
jgi:Family of unknown function (DUF6165)